MLRRQTVIEHVDPFIGSRRPTCPSRTGWPRPGGGRSRRSATPIPGATYPFGMVSACAYSGAYPTGYGLYELNTEGVPPRLHDRQLASGFTHFQQSGTGAIRKYYNYFRVTPMLEPLDALGSSWDLLDERGRARLLRRHPVLGHPLRAHRRPAQRGPPLHLPGLTGTPGSSSTSRWAAWPSRTAPPSRCAPTWRPSDPASPRPRWSSRVPRWPSTSSATPATGGSCCGTTGG